MPVSSEESVSSLWRSYQENYDGQRGPGLSTMSEWGFPAGVVLGSEPLALSVSDGASCNYSTTCIIGKKIGKTSSTVLHVLPTCA